MPWLRKVCKNEETALSFHHVGDLLEIDEAIPVVTQLQRTWPRQLGHGWNDEATLQFESARVKSSDEGLTRLEGHTDELVGWQVAQRVDPRCATFLILQLVHGFPFSVWCFKNLDLVSQEDLTVVLLIN